MKHECRFFLTISPNSGLRGVSPLLNSFFLLISELKGFKVVSLLHISRLLVIVLCESNASGTVLKKEKKAGFGAKIWGQNKRPDLGPKYGAKIWGQNIEPKYGAKKRKKRHTCGTH